jgi:sulfhydrogenase subunit gamma (sulfur reductase)
MRSIHLSSNCALESLASSSPPRYDHLQVLDAWDETPTLRGIALDFSIQAVPHRPGQAIKLRVGDEQESYFSLASSRGEDGRAELLIKRGSLIANEVIDKAIPGAELECTAPIGIGFPVEKAIGMEVVLFAAGSGISPIRSLLQHLVSKRDDFACITLFYGQHRSTDFAYAKEHEAWRNAGIDLVLCCSSPDAKWHGARGYVQEVARNEPYRARFANDTVAFICGMARMVADVRSMLQEAEMAPERIFVNI